MLPLQHHSVNGKACVEVMSQITNFNQILKQFLPFRPAYAFAYGSRVKVQANDQVAKSQIDLVLAVDDSVTFHRANLQRNPSHYSFLKYFGPNSISAIQEKIPCGVYYNTLVPIDGQLVKYGIVQIDQLVDDLLDWKFLYLAGRLHKPVEELIEPSTDSLKDALKINLKSAVHAALLLLDESFSEEQLYLEVASLSYSGDFRMLYGENPSKVKNIVTPQIAMFRKLYQETLTQDSLTRLVHWNGATKSFVQDTSPSAILHHLSLLPKTVQRKLYLGHNRHAVLDLEDVLNSLSHSYTTKNEVRKAIESIVWRSSWLQSLKGIATAGMRKSIRYSLAKIRKMYAGMREEKQQLESKEKT